MKFLENIERFGYIDSYDVEGELATLIKLDDKKPSKRIIKTKKGKVAIAALKELELNHNHSWYKELKIRSKDNLQSQALFYRGKKITFEEMFKKSDEIAKSLLNCGIVKGDEIPVCVSNTPELVYILLAANKIGAKVNLFGSHFDSEYLNYILDGCTDKIFIASDDIYDNISATVGKRKYKNKVLISLADSLPENPSLCDEYEPKLSKYYHYENKVLNFKEDDNSIMSFSDFVEFGKNYSEEVIDNNTLDTDFLITYTSGSTKSGFPSQLIHSNRSLITSGRFHDSELSGNPKIVGLRGLAHIHPESNTDVITCISDNLMQLWSVALEPEYGKSEFIDYIFINKPNYLNATTSFLVEFAKKYLYDKNYIFSKRKMPFLFAAFAVGENTSKGEEKLINKMLRQSRAGSGISIGGFSLPFTTLCIGGGDCEHGGIYYSLWKSLFEKVYKFRLKRREYGMMPESYVHVTTLKEIGDNVYTECDYNEDGIIVANSATTMRGYKNDKKKTKKLIVRDIYGRDWVSSNVYGYIDEIGGVHVRGRVGNEIMLNDGTLLPLHFIDEIICDDTKNILSCTSVVSSDFSNSNLIVLNVEFQPNKRMSDFNVIKSLFDRCKNIFSEDIYSRIVVRIIDNDSSYPLTGSGKRDFKALEELELDDTYIFNNGTVCKFSNNKVKEYKK